MLLDHTLNFTAAIVSYFVRIPAVRYNDCVQPENVLGIDIGKAKTGVARAVGTLAQPLTVIREKDTELLTSKIVDIAKREEAQKIVIGLPQGEIESLARSVGERLVKSGLSVVYWDETLTTQDSQRLAIAANIPVKKRHELEDAFSASLMLQSYLDHV